MYKIVKHMSVGLFYLSLSVQTATGHGKISENSDTRPDTHPGTHKALIAVATNFQTTAQALVKDFETRTHTDKTFHKKNYNHKKNYKISLTSGSTGKIYAQIRNGAPYDLFLAADQVRPKLLEHSPFGVKNSRFTYARGQLILWGKATYGVTNVIDETTLYDGKFRRLAMAHPNLAPYGLAAKQVLQSMGLWTALHKKIVTGENVGQAYALIHTRSAEFGFIARSSLASLAHAAENQQGQFWLIPRHLYTPINQDAILLKSGEHNAAAQAFASYLKSPQAGKIMTAFGYQTLAQPEHPKADFNLIDGHKVKTDG